MNQETSSAVHAPDLDAASRIANIRTRLPGQMLRQRIDMATVCHGPLYTLAEVRRRVAETLPYKFGYVRGVRLEPIEEYRESIPDEALLKYDDAFRSGLFARFWVATPTYYEERQVDPWIIGEVEGAERFAVVARW